jgi:hypothetical protein
MAMLSDEELQFLQSGADLAYSNPFSSGTNRG